MWYYGGMTGFTRCAASDFTNEGNIKIKAGQRVTCTTIHAFDPVTGYARCKLFGTQVEVKMPPGLVMDCPAADNKYRPILLQYMRPPASTERSSAATAAAGSAAAAAGAGLAAGQAAAAGGAAGAAGNGGGGGGGAAAAVAAAGTFTLTALYDVDTANRAAVA
jgi:hypothetical protein